MVERRQEDGSVTAKWVRVGDFRVPLDWLEAADREAERRGITRVALFRIILLAAIEKGFQL